MIPDETSCAGASSSINHAPLASLASSARRAKSKFQVATPLPSRATPRETRAEPARTAEVAAFQTKTARSDASRHPADPWTPANTQRRGNWSRRLSEDKSQPHGGHEVEALHTRASVTACSGQALTHNPQASQASGLGSSACCQRWAKPFSRPLRLSPALCARGSVSTLKTETGHTRTHAALPSHRLRSITGRNTPAGCLHSSSVGIGGLRDGAC